MPPSLSHVILAHGEPQFFDLINLLKPTLEKDDRLLVLNDPTTDDYESRLKQAGIRVINHAVDKDYAAHRNFAVDKLKTDYVWMHDADEQPAPDLLKSVKAILQESRPDGLWMPRLNLFEGVLPVHALHYGWALQGNVVNWPDMQCRLFRLRQGIRFVGKLHERPRFEKHHYVAQLPLHEKFAIIHRKSIDTQLSQNEFYNANFSRDDNAGQTTQKLLQ